MNGILEQTDPRVVGQRLADARKAAGITQADAADRLGMSRPTYIAIEKGAREAKAEEIIDLARLFGRTVHEIVRPGGPPVTLAPHLRSALDPAARDTDQLAGPIKELEDLATDYRELERLLDSPMKVVHPPEVVLPSRGDIVQFAEDVAARERDRLQLGDGPVHDLRKILETKVGVRVFYGELPRGFSGMYVYVTDLGYCIWINSLHPRTRRRVSLAHEYGHFLCDRHKPGVDRTGEGGRKPRNEQFCDAFAMSFLMPRVSVRQFFHDVLETTKDFQLADLVRLSSYFDVALEAATRRLEILGLVGRGTWEMLKERGFSPKKARADVGLDQGADEADDPLPERYRLLAVKAFRQDLITEGQLARFLRCDRLEARETVERLSGQVVDVDGGPERRQADLSFSLFSEAV